MANTYAAYYGGASPDDVKRRRSWAESMLAESMQATPVAHPLQAVARALQGAMGGYLAHKSDQTAKEEQAKAMQSLLAAMQPANTMSDAPSPGFAGPQPSMPQTVQPMSSRIYDQNEFNPLDAAVATKDELAAGVPAPKQYAHLIGKAAVDNDLPPALLAAQLKQESGFDPDVISGRRVSSAGAQGISQFMPGTAKEMGINPLDPAQAIPAGARYLRQNIDRFGGSVPLGLAAYNAGPGRVAQAGGDMSRLPAETRGYVANITGAQPTQTAQAGGIDPRLLAVASNPWLGSAGQAIAGKLIAQGMKDPLDVEAKRLDIETKRRGLDAAPTVQRIKMPDNSERAFQYDPAAKKWVPLATDDQAGTTGAPMPKLTEVQSKDVGFYNRGQKLLPRLEKQDTALTDILSAGGGAISNYFKTDAYRQAEQTGRELLAVILRKDTGAAVTPSEMQLYGNIYLPVPGDDAATIQQKRIARQTAMEGIRMGLGPAEIIFKSREALEAAKGAPPPEAATGAPAADGWQTIDGVRIREKK